ncbi:hypothetical protein CBOM_05558 [Ceraceosorus bombacis]|uniref:Uncharacterized protein n=1 Tax=Ceraceosorus bombacis TaxID=401625 RepID=A0A0P1BR69_9BASI|nr:hypothetical protein CBOM_05558 [Ceraceosorus bombacis]
MDSLRAVWQARSEYPGTTRGLGIEHAIARDNLPTTLKGGSSVGSVGKDASARPSYLTTPRGSNTGDAPNRSGNALLSPAREDFNGERVAMQMAVGLPVAYTHGGNTPKLPASPPNRSVALPGLPSLMRADYSQAEPPIRAVTRRDPHAVAFPASAPATQTKTDFGEAAGERTLDSAQLRRGASVSSGEGGSSGAASATFNRSTNTSMTSLRAPSSALPTASGKKSTESFSPQPSKYQLCVLVSSIVKRCSVADSSSGY